MKNKYTFQILWSEEDKAFVAVCEEFPGLSAFGDTHEGALQEAQTALALMIETYKEKGVPLPEPKTGLLEVA